jgi:hypothetical protein
MTELSGRHPEELGIQNVWRRLLQSTKGKGLLMDFNRPGTQAKQRLAPNEILERLVQ